MPNRPLRTCPTCSGTGHPSFVRSGVWLNEHCPGKNGPIDADDYPEGHELDCASRRGLARVEYKRDREGMLPGQQFHFQALHASVRSDWTWLLLLVADEGQSVGGQPVRFRWLTSKQPWREPQSWPEHRTSLASLGKGVADWMWRNGPRPIFLEPMAPDCASCGGELPERPSQTMPISGTNGWVCLSCFQSHFGLRRVK